MRSAILYGLLIGGFVWTIFGMWLMNYPLSGLQQTSFFFDYLSANVIVGSVALIHDFDKVPSRLAGKQPQNYKPNFASNKQEHFAYFPVSRNNFRVI